ncbi:hypothetical protein JZ751_012946 [Albula glossodonta]|uniref:Uncharacterized protein n=1 Tax=Albula glossodonta TaxID=121402 RepID=A0A8T2N061_9TELE|nr:hypothetical protein JZ751_012946 [Albula glossodonta]
MSVQWGSERTSPHVGEPPAGMAECDAGGCRVSQACRWGHSAQAKSRELQAAARVSLLAMAATVSEGILRQNRLSPEGGAVPGPLDLKSAPQETSAVTIADLGHCVSTSARERTASLTPQRNLQGLSGGGALRGRGSQGEGLSEGGALSQREGLSEGGALRGRGSHREELSGGGALSQREGLSQEELSGGGALRGRGSQREGFPGGGVLRGRGSQREGSQREELSEGGALSQREGLSEGGALSQREGLSEEGALRGRSSQGEGLSVRGRGSQGEGLSEGGALRGRGSQSEGGALRGRGSQGEELSGGGALSQREELSEGGPLRGRGSQGEGLSEGGALRGRGSQSEGGALRGRGSQGEELSGGGALSQREELSEGGPLRGRGSHREELSGGGALRGRGSQGEGLSVAVCVGIELRLGLGLSHLDLRIAQTGVSIAPWTSGVRRQACALRHGPQECADRRVRCAMDLRSAQTGECADRRVRCAMDLRSAQTGECADRRVRCAMDLSSAQTGMCVAPWTSGVRRQACALRHGRFMCCAALREISLKQTLIAPAELITRSGLRLLGLSALHRPPTHHERRGCCAVCGHVTLFLLFPVFCGGAADLRAGAGWGGAGKPAVYATCHLTAEDWPPALTKQFIMASSAGALTLGYAENKLIVPGQGKQNPAFTLTPQGWRSCFCCDITQPPHSQPPQHTDLLPCCLHCDVEEWREQNRGGACGALNGITREQAWADWDKRGVFYFVGWGGSLPRPRMSVPICGSQLQHTQGYSKHTQAHSVLTSHGLGGRVIVHSDS